jgi:hypothetical protein
MFPMPALRRRLRCLWMSAPMACICPTTAWQAFWFRMETPKRCLSPASWTRKSRVS